MLKGGVRIIHDQKKVMYKMGIPKTEINRGLEPSGLASRWGRLHLTRLWGTWIRETLAWWRRTSWIDAWGRDETLWRSSITCRRDARPWRCTILGETTWRGTTTTSWWGYRLRALWRHLWRWWTRSGPWNWGRGRTRVAESNWSWSPSCTTTGFLGRFYNFVAIETKSLSCGD